MGLSNTKNFSCPHSPNPCACTCINCSTHHHLPYNNFHLNQRRQLPERTTAFNGNPFYSCQHQKQRKNKHYTEHSVNKWFNSNYNNKMCDKLRGQELLKSNRFNKDLAFTMRERESLAVKGLLPPVVRSQETQMKAAMDTIRDLKEPLAKYVYLRDLQDYNERLYYRLLSEYTKELMPIVYTPTVGEACIKFSHIYKRPRGLYITVHDAGHILSILSNWPEKNVKAICVTDGERILGLGDLGANGMGIPIGKLSLYTALSGVPPYLTLPITIDVGTNNESLLNDPMYIGLKQKRVRGPQYEDLLDEFMEAVIKKWGRSCLIQFEDFGNANAFHLLQKYKDNFCTFNDDIQGTASVVLAGILASAKLTGLKIQQNTFLLYGAGEAAIGIAGYLAMIMEENGLTKEQARSRIYLVDSKGLVVRNRSTGGINGHKQIYVKDAKEMTNLLEIVETVRPTALLGASAQQNAFTPDVIRKMGEINRRPIIFALSNPTSKCECTAEDAYNLTNGRCIFASGSPFDPVILNGVSLMPAQGNNAFIFPGVSLAIMACNVHHIPEETFIVAAKALADQVTKEDLEKSSVYPSLDRIREVCLKIAAKVTQYFFVESLATIRPEPEDKLLFIQGMQYDYYYDQSHNNNNNNNLINFYKS